MSRLTRLTVRGFRSIRALEDFELRSLNVLIGANGAGKSNLMAFFHMLARIAVGGLQFFMAENDGPDALLFGGRKRTEAIEAECEFGKNSYRFAISPAADRMVFTREERFLAGDPSGSDSASGGANEEARLLTAGVDDQPMGRSRLRDTVAGWRVYHFHDTGKEARVRQKQPVRDNLRLKSDGGNLAPFLRRLRERHPDHCRQIVEVVRLAAPFFGDFVYRREAGDQMDLEWFEAKDKDTVLGPRQLSDGTLRFICLAALLLQPAPSQPELILVDEPELGLHPLALTLVAEMLQSASEARQVIVSTQSADLVSELEPEEVVVVDRRDEASTFRRLDRSDLSEWLKDYALGDLWKMNILGGRPA